MYKIIVTSVLLLFITTQPLLAQRKGKKKKKNEPIAVVENIIPILQRHITTLASDSMQGRRTGTMGEQLASQYIQNTFMQYGIPPKGIEGSYFQTFDIKEGLVYEEGSSFYINDNPLTVGKDFFPLNQSANASKNEIVSPILNDQNTVWFLDVREQLKKQEKNPHYDITPFINEKIKEYELKGATGMLIINSGKQEDNLAFDKKAITTMAKIPVIYLSKEIAKRYLKDSNNAIDIKFTIAIKEKVKTGTNVLAYIDNNAENTVIIGAHYDHLGYGEDKNSLYTGADKMVHNGADDNASGVAALLEMSKLVKQSKYKKNNFLFIAFSGEELGLYGSKYFVENPTINIAQVNYMINMDMIGRLNDSTKAFTIGGYGTSPTWGTLIKEGQQEADNITIKLDSSGTGPSDHSSFYRKNIPVLFFFTGTHSDYHKPSDDAEKINYGGEEKIVKYITTLLTKTETIPKLTFAKTRESATGSSSTRFTVSLGIMPDYTYSGAGVRADGVSEGKLAQRIGIQAGDIITKLGDNNITSVENYMKVLGKFKKGDRTTLKTIRGGKEMSYDITF